jgi:oligopeptide transport system substrate-binding protein
LIGQCAHKLIHWRARLAVLLCVSLLGASGCFETEQGELYYGRVRAPREQEFRWSDGGLPQTFDPALASAPPDTDAVRALFEGLTDYDPQTLAPVAGVATRWESSADKRTWTFYLRHDAHWSNGAPVTAQDFLRSWQRTLRLGDRAPHADLLANIVGATHEPQRAPTNSTTATPTPEPKQARDAQAQPTATPNDLAQAQPTPETKPPSANAPHEAPPAFGVEVVNEYTLRVQLQRPDANFPALVAHPVFRPVQLSDEPEPGKEGAPPAAHEPVAVVELKTPVVTNGAFQLANLSADNVVLERAENYWNKDAVALERVYFVNAHDTEAALAAYRAGDVDAVTNANIEPLAVKLLAPYKDFRRATFGALTYYEFNTAHAPFDDPRIRQALTLAVDRARLSADTLEGATEPADKFLPTDETAAAPGEDKQGQPAEVKIVYDVPRAQKLLREAGFPGGVGFPLIHLLVNRNEQHREVAQAVAAMWREHLGIETEIVVKSWDDYEAALRTGAYDVARRSIVMQTTDEETNMLAMFAPPAEPDANNNGANAAPPPSGSSSERAAGKTTTTEQKKTLPQVSQPPILTEAQALAALPALPVYFASSYALVKPYVSGFDANLLDAPSLQRVRLDTNWQPPNDKQNH